MNIKEALRLANVQTLDLVEIVANAMPPVCKIMDYGKYKYEQQKKEKDTRKKQKIITVKEIKMRPGIEKHDLETKTRHVREFLQNGDKVKCTIMFRGRQLSHPELGRAILYRIVELMKDIAKVEKEPKLEGRNMIIILIPFPLK